MSNTPPARTFNFPFRHQVRIDSGSHHTPQLIEHTNVLSKLKRPELEGTLLLPFSGTNLIQLYVTTSVLRNEYLFTVPVTFRRLHGMGGQHISPQILNPCSGWQGIVSFKLRSFQVGGWSPGNTEDAVGHCHNSVIDTQIRQRRCITYRAYTAWICQTNCRQWGRSSLSWKNRKGE